MADVPNILTPEAVHAACDAFQDARINQAHIYNAIRANINAAIAKLIEQGNAEVCKTFAWSDGEEHKFGNGEYDLHDVIVIKVQSYV